MKAWKRNAVIATVLVFICAGVYLNWSYNQKEKTPELTQTLSAEQVMGETTMVIADASEEAEPAANMDAADYFAQVRLSRQESRDSAVELLEETIAYDEGTAVGDTASATLNTLVNTALSEAQIESMVIAKGFADCVTYITDDTVSVAVAAPAEGLSEADAALISDVVRSQTDYPLSQVRIIEVKPYGQHGFWWRAGTLSTFCAFLLEILWIYGTMSK